MYPRLNLGYAASCPVVFGLSSPGRNRKRFSAPPKRDEYTSNPAADHRFPFLDGTGGRIWKGLALVSCRWFGIVPLLNRVWFGFGSILVHLRWFGRKDLQSRFDFGSFLIRFWFAGENRENPES